MTTIKRFTPDYIMHAARFEAFAREAEHGEYVLFDAHQQVVSALKAERDALAVENACLVRAITDHKNSTHFCERCGEDDPCATDDVCSVLRGIPDTDSSIAAFEAQGVEKFADFLDSPIDGQHCYQHEVGLARHFASTLREAK
ncbi:hypothetical protein [Serratia marcescens]|uniref:hypothetical protein n=1 Tax=Serratia marcescens TaxID=615 RepID=UPI0007452475|nr:hypothetical protein [Serratia marcescens]MBN3904745.1 hypothetical protein [Serratia marcescens]MBN3916310.1 hypothetical protein [Serratia marcescens]MBN3921339.1 hypothetical protein [Serratia marcescens]MBN3938054.1 hypothetical protein [Serratia marcescens]MBN3957038.1 hypothetical protein [Serratia marcescens]